MTSLISTSVTVDCNSLGIGHLQLSDILQVAEGLSEFRIEMSLDEFFAEFLIVERIGCVCVVDRVVGSVIGREEGVAAKRLTWLVVYVKHRKEKCDKWGCLRRLKRRRTRSGGRASNQL